jgi:hypothetical protein
MAQFIVAVDHITYYAVQAKDEVTAIDLVLEGEGLEISSETRDASITEYELSTPRRHASPYNVSRTRRIHHGSVYRPR